MKCRSIFVLLILLVFSFGLGWCDGEVVHVLKDPRTGVILPLQRTPVGVERQQLNVRLVRREESPSIDFEIIVDFEYRVESIYRLYNPTEKEQVLKVAFPIPNDVILREPPVWLDGTMVRWQLLTPIDFLELHRNEMQRVFVKMLKKRKALHTVLQEALKEVRITPGKEGLKGGEVAPNYPEFPWQSKAFQAYKEQLHRELGIKSLQPVDLQPLWKVYLDLKGKWRCSIWDLAWVVYMYANYRPPLLSEWAVFDWFLAPASGRVIRQSRAKIEEWMPEWREQFKLNLLIFDLHLKPKSRHQLTIKYQQPVGTAYYYGADTGFEVHGFHFVYVLKIRRSWAFFGPIETRVFVPKYFQIRSFPPLKFAGISNSQRVYVGTLVPYRYNLYLVAGTPEVFLPRVILKTADGRVLEEIIGRRFDSHYIYVPLRKIQEHIASSFKLVWDKKTRTATVYCGKEKHAVIAVGQKTMHLHGKEVKLPAPAKLFDGCIWIPVQALLKFKGECPLYPPYHMVKRMEFDRQTGNVSVFLRLQ